MSSSPNGFEYLSVPCRHFNISCPAGATYVDYDHASDAFGIWSWEGIPGAAAERSGTLQALKRDGDSGAELPLSKVDIIAWAHADSSATAALTDRLLADEWSRHTTNLKVRHRDSVACPYCSSTMSDVMSTEWAGARNSTGEQLIKAVPRFVHR